MCDNFYKYALHTFCIFGNFTSYKSSWVPYDVNENSEVQFIHNFISHPLLVKWNKKIWFLMNDLMQIKCCKLF